MTDFDLAATVSQDEAQCVIKHPATDELTTWIWTFYGPGHPRTIEVANRASREALREAKAQQEARINGKKWKADDQSIDDMRAKNVDNIVARTASFTPVKMAGQTIVFSPDAAKQLLLDRKMGWLFMQIIEFLREDENFMLRSATS